MKRYEIIRCAWRANRDRDLKLGESRTPPIWGLFDHKLNRWAIKDVHRRLIQERIKDEGLDMNEKIGGSSNELARRRMHCEPTLT